jgi:CO/xanthine dehydrogenase Mo-binding subunit
MGCAVRSAAEDLVSQLVELAGPILGASNDDLRVESGAIVARGGELKMSFEELLHARFGPLAGQLVGAGICSPPYEAPDGETGQSKAITPFWMLAGAGAEVDVDTETGRVRVLKLVEIADPGVAVNPNLIAAQLRGGAIQQLGMTLSEELLFVDGQLTNAGLALYKVPVAEDVPAHVETGIVSDSAAFPIAKGIGESGTLATSAAIGNAVFDATGARVRDLPLTPERILRALRVRRGLPIEDES